MLASYFWIWTNGQPQLAKLQYFPIHSWQVISNFLFETLGLSVLEQLSNKIILVGFYFGNSAWLLTNEYFPDKKWAEINTR